ncbi:MAG: hypothetical protein EXS32_07015 [Opitutus sp.]|nr:hypothetical protein [Opitutus sp.]
MPEAVPELEPPPDSFKLPEEALITPVLLKAAWMSVFEVPPAPPDFVKVPALAKVDEPVLERVPSKLVAKVAPELLLIEALLLVSIEPPVQLELPLLVNEPPASAGELLVEIVRVVPVVEDDAATTTETDFAGLPRRAEVQSAAGESNRAGTAELAGRFAGIRGQFERTDRRIATVACWNRSVAHVGRIAIARSSSSAGPIGAVVGISATATRATRPHWFVSAQGHAQR